METTHGSISLKSIPAVKPEIDLHTVPRYSSWFSWDEIHKIERTALREFFDGSSITRTPKVYKEYRDFIISKYRDEPSRWLTFTEIRKALVGDVSVLHKVFTFLEKWGLINFSASSGHKPDLALEGEEKNKVMIEEGPPNGVRVVSIPNSLKPMSAPLGFGRNDAATDNISKLPPLASFSDVFGDVMKYNNRPCQSCGEYCDTRHYLCMKENFVICFRCFETGNYGKDKSPDDFKPIEGSGNSGGKGASWTEAETLLLLESVLKHGDEWELVAHAVKTKSKLDCIAKLIQLPFGEFMLGSIKKRDSIGSINGKESNTKQVENSLLESQETMKTEDQCHEQNGENENGCPPSKKRRTATSSLMKQVAYVSTMINPHVAAAAADAAVMALCDECQCPREIFDGEDDNIFYERGASTSSYGAERVLHVGDLEMKERTNSPGNQGIPSEENGIPLTLRYRAAVATALGAAAAHAKLLADQELREIEHLMGTIIGAEVKKLHHKINLLEDLELIMDKEFTHIEELEESIIDERISLLQRALNDGVSMSRDYLSVKSQTGAVL